MKTKEEIIEMINEVYECDITNLRSIGFVDGLRWVIEEELEGEYDIDDIYDYKCTLCLHHRDDCQCNKNGWR